MSWDLKLAKRREHKLKCIIFLYGYTAINRVSHMLGFKRQQENFDSIYNSGDVRSGVRAAFRSQASVTSSGTATDSSGRNAERDRSALGQSDRQHHVLPSSANQNHLLLARDRCGVRNGRDTGTGANEMTPAVCDQWLTTSTTTQRMSVNIYERFAAGGLTDAVFDGFRQISPTNRTRFSSNSITADSPLWLRLIWRLSIACDWLFH